LGRPPADLQEVRRRLLDDHYDAEYWTRQLRLGAFIAVSVTCLGILRVLADWPASERWLAVPLAVAAVAQAVAFFLPWRRIVQHHVIRRALILWWAAQLPMLAAFAAMDTLSILIYLPSAILVVMMATPLFSPRTVLSLGTLAMAGFTTLMFVGGYGSGALAAGHGGILAIVIGLSAATAANRERQEARRRTLERRTEALLENASDAVLALDRQGDVAYASPSVHQMLGYEPVSVTGERLRDLVHPEDLVTSAKWMTSLFDAPPAHVSRLETRLRRADGTWLYADVIGVNRTADPDLEALVLSVRDVGQRRALEEELTRQAFEDSLTGLANRALFRDRVDHALARSRRDGGRVTLLLIDVDDFKVVNDGLGHTAGDRLLCELAGRLRTEVRSCDTLARLGGDEFAVLVEGLDDLETAALADRIVAVARRPIRLGARDVTCTVSVGIATAKAGDGEPETDELLRDADLAMYAAKNGGRDRSAMFDPAMHADVLREAQQRSDLERALTEEQFVVHYQPIVDLRQRRLTGFEALVRWHHPQEGLVPPNTFIPLAETTGLIVPLGRWVLRKACEQLARWHAERPSAAGLRMSVNLSARQFHYDGLVADVADALERSGIDPSCLILEITESMLMRDTTATIGTLRALKDLGVRLAIDDFGTGYSSLSYLRQFPVDILKIDRSFVEGVAGEGGDATLAEAVVQMSRALRLQTVAEGIETTDQWSALRTLGCEFGQGYLFARPIEAARVEALLDDPDGALKE
jgi:diguanylate cyclase (GGDEF)-like protein/PAS domain S-box-containing protein